MNKLREPYCYLFFLGIISAILGVFLWPAFDWFGLSFYPRSAHANLMVFGFMWSFISGFLMTAVPRMTQTNSASKNEIYVAGSLVFSQWILNLLGLVEASQALFAFQILFLSLFAFSRFKVRRQIPFEGFVFLPFSLLSALAGILLSFGLGEDGLGLLYLYSGQAFILNLICGLGSRLIPLLSRVPTSTNPDSKEPLSKMTEMILLACALNISFALEGFKLQLLGWALRAVVLTLIAYRHFKIFKRPTVRSFVGWGLRLSVSIMILGYGVLALGTSMPLPVLHLIFISGFTLLTIMVATRVTSAHGGAGTDLELSSKSLLVVIFSLNIAAVLRWMAGLDVVRSWLLMGAIFFFGVAIFVWLKRFFRILFPGV